MITIKANRWAVLMMDTMKAAFEAMESGDYNEAFKILEKQCKPQGHVLTKPMTSITMQGYRTAVEMIAKAPVGVAPEHAYSLAHAAEWISRVIEKQDTPLIPDDLLLAAEFAHDFGLRLAWEADAEGCKH